MFRKVKIAVLVLSVVLGLAVNVLPEKAFADANIGDEVTGTSDMGNGETKEGDFTITGGPVRSPNPGTATIKDGTITNNASNSAKGGYSSSKGSALISRASGGFNLDNLVIESTDNNLVLNIWANASINANNLTLKGSGNSSSDVPFLMIGAYPKGGAGTLNFTGESSIEGATGSIIGGNNNSNINVNSGTLTIKDSEIKVNDGIKINVKSGATLVFDNSKFEQSVPTIVLEDGATLIVKNGSTFTTIPNAGAFNIGSGTTVTVDNATFNLGVNAGMNIAEGGKLEVINESTLNMTGNETNGINSSGDIVIDGSTVNGKDKKTKVTSKGTLNITDSNLNTVLIEHQTDANITGSDLNDCMIKVGAGTTLNIESSKLHDSSRNGEETMIHSNGDGVTINITDSEVYDNKNSGSREGSTIVKVLNGTLNVTGSTFTNNQSNAWGGAIYVNNTELSVSGSTFEENKITNETSGGGGAIAVIDSPVTIENSTFTKNEGNLKGKGGAIYVNNNGKESLTIDDASTFEGNSAQIGGAIYINGVPDVTIGKATFSGNGFDGKEYGAQDAGAIYIESQSGETKVTLNGTEFDENAAYGPASSSGGAIYVRAGTGAYKYSDCNLYVNGAKFTNNTSGLYGGAMTVAHGARAYISDLDGEPTEFIGNMVQYATDHAGGGLFINQGYVHMDDVAIYNNYAKDGGGGLSSCTKGAAEAKVLGGAAIFDNHVGSTFLDGKDSVVDGVDLKGNSNAFPHEDIESYPDIFFETKDHINRETGEQLREWEIWPIELYERMFNGGLHKWDAKPFDGKKINSPETLLNSFMAKSNPTNTDISAAKVVFTENVATSLGQTTWTSTGGAIGCNGLLEMGSGTEIKIVKVWDDERDNDGYRPDMDGKFLDSLIVKGNDTVIDIKSEPIKTEVVNIKDFDPAALANNIVNMADPQKQKDYSDYDAWVIVISGLDLLDEEGNQIIYTVTEKDPEYYSMIENLGDNETYFEMKNRHNPDLVNISVTKVWDDEGNNDGKRPESITVNLLADGEEVEEMTATAEGEWKVAFEDLPRYKDGAEIVYTISEDSIEDYEAKIELKEEKVNVTEETQQDVIVEQITVEKEYTITNTHSSETTEVKVTKVWDDQDDVDGIRPTSILIRLLADGTETGDTLTLDASSDWKGSFSNLPKKKAGKEIVYTIQENVPSGYEAEITGTSDEGFTVTNTHIPEEKNTVSFTVYKKWDDSNDFGKRRPKEVTVRLLVDGEYTGESRVLKESNSWAVAFANLPEGPEYTIEEVEVKYYKPTYEGSPEEGFTITNKYTERNDTPDTGGDEPKTPDKKKTPDEPKTPDKKKESPKSGDENNPLGYLAVIALSGMFIGLVHKKMRTRI